MKNTFSLVIASILILGAPSLQAGGVAVLDIDAVARELGVEENVQRELASLQKGLARDLQKSQAQLQSEMNGVETAAGENPSEAQLRQIRATSQQLNSEFNRLKQQAERTLAQERVRLINEFRTRLEPIAREAAAEKELDVILMKVTPPVFTFAPEVDITETTTRLAIEAGMEIENPEPAPAEESEEETEEETEEAEEAEDEGPAIQSGEEAAE